MAATRSPRCGALPRSGRPCRNPAGSTADGSDFRGFVAFLLLAIACATAAIDNEIGIVWYGEEPTPHDDADSVLLAVPHMRQEHDLCVTTSAAMVMAFYGDPHGPRELKVLSKGKVYDPEAPFTDFTATWWRDLISGIEPLGYSWREEVFPANSRGFAQGLEQIEASLRSGRPVLIDVALYDSHTFVIMGLDKTGKRLFIRDPNVDRPGLRVLGFDQLKPIWHGRSYGLNARPALFTKPASLGGHSLR